jgi:hypothetical protein
MPGLSPAAWALLVARLRCRTRAVKTVILALVVTVAGSVAIAVWLWSMRSWPGWVRSPGTTTAIGFGLLDLLMLGARELAARAENALAVTLPHRVGRAQAVPLRVILGPVRKVFLLTSLTLAAVLVVAIPFAHADRYAWTYAFVFAGAMAAVLIQIRRSLTRATIAIDATSLAIDERLRAQEVLTAMMPLSAMFYVPMGLSTWPLPSTWFLLLWAFSTAATMGLWVWAAAQPPWQSSPRIAQTAVPPEPSPVSR